MKYITKSYTVDAVQFTGPNILEVMTVIDSHLVTSYTDFTYVTSEAYQTLAVNVKGLSTDVPIGTWLVTGYDIAGVKLMTDDDFNKEYALQPKQSNT